MNLSIGIVGLPNVGKSTLFNALTKKSVPADNYPFCTIDPSVGIVPVPDSRLDVLARLSNSKKVIPAVISFVDIAGLVKGASEGQGLGNQFLSHIRETDAIVEVVRIYENSEIIHVERTIDPLRDIDIINMELILADMSTVEKRSQTIGRDVKRGDKDAIKLSGLLERSKVVFDDGKLANSLMLDEDEKKLVQDLHLITMKPILYVLNKQSGGKNLYLPRRSVDAKAGEYEDDRFKNLIEYFKEHNFHYCIVDAKIEDELKDFVGAEKEDMRSMLLSSASRDEPKNLSGVEGNNSSDGINNLIKAGYELLGLETFLTTGEDETRAWTIKMGSTAPIAGQAIHTDFKDKFIRAEVIHYDDLVREGSYASARPKGLVRTEGKDYVVQDGDVVEFKI